MIFKKAVTDASIDSSLPHKKGIVFFAFVVAAVLARFVTAVTTGTRNYIDKNSEVIKPNDPKTP
jgi:hypothetical protein